MEEMQQLENTVSQYISAMARCSMNITGDQRDAIIEFYSSLLGDGYAFVSKDENTVSWREMQDMIDVVCISMSEKNQAAVSDFYTHLDSIGIVMIPIKTDESALADTCH